jgi:hypothetical protein
MDKDVSAFGKLGEVVRSRGIAGDHNRSIGSVEPIRERWHHWRMIDQCGPDRHLVITQDQSSLAELMNMDQRLEWDASFVRRSRVNVVLIHIEKQPGHLRKRWRSPRVDAGAETSSPGEPDQVPIIGVVIGVVVRHEDVPERGQRDIRHHKLASHAVATVDDIRDVVPDDDLSRR